MPAQETSGRYDKVILWPYVGRDEFNELILSEPQEIEVRWSPASYRDTGDLSIDAQALVDQKIALGSLMLKMELDEWVGTGSGPAEDEVMEVVKYHEIPDIKSRDIRRTVFLKRYQGHVPLPPVTGEVTGMDMIVTAAGITNRDCDTCLPLNASTEARIITNTTALQEWRSAFIDVGVTGSGTDPCDGEWQWLVQRRIHDNIITVSLLKEDFGTCASWRVTGANWDGVSPLTLPLSSGNTVCSWPATVTLRGEDYVAPTGDLRVLGEGFTVGTCQNCTGLNANFDLDRVIDTPESVTWRTVGTFSFDGARYFWEVTTTASPRYTELELRRSPDGNLRAMWATDEAWDLSTQLKLDFAGASVENCCGWPATLDIKGI